MHRIFRRKIYDTLIKWKKDRNGQTAMLIKGARRVGKSTIAREFAKKEYQSYIEINFAKVDPEVKELFNDLSDLDYIFLRLQAIFNVKLENRKSVLVFDEIQKCPKAREAIKFLVEDGRYDYIETGSLLSIKKHKEGIIIPSEETRITMYPMDFEEFLEAIGETQIFPLLQYSFNNLRSLGEATHRKILRLFRLYMLVGGMPQAVKRYVQTNNLAEVDAIKREIIELYVDDLREVDESGRASRIFETIPGELSRNKLRYNVGSVIKNASSLNLDSVWKDLEDSLTVNICYRCTDPNVGMTLHKDMSYFKLYMGDTGLFVTLAFWDQDVADNLIYNKLLSDKLSADLGYIYENAVAQMLKTAGKSLFYYTFPADKEEKNHYEIDFLTLKDNKLQPLEVKSSGYMAHKSLDMFCIKYKHRIGRPILLYTKDIRTDSETICLPVYMTPLL